MTKKVHSPGFSIAGVLIIMLVVTIVGFGGWYVWDKNKKDDNTNKSDKTLQNNKEEEKPVKETISLLDGRVNFVDDGSWKVATGGYWSLENGRCGRDTGFDEGCLDHKMLILANETFTNPDQFQVNISVFKNDGAPGTSLEQWIDLDVGPGGTNPKRTYPTFGGHKAYRYEVAYDESDVRLVYGITFEDKIVVIRSNFFEGNHYSYKSANNYLPLLSQVDKLVESISFQ
jgi:hypothetical protein